MKIRLKVAIWNGKKPKRLQRKAEKQNMLWKPSKHYSSHLIHLYIISFYITKKFSLNCVTNWCDFRRQKIEHFTGQYSILLTCSFRAFRGHLKHSVGVSLHLHSSVMITKGQTTTKQKNKTKEEGGKKGEQVNDFPT